MNLTQREIDKLLIFTAAEVARRRKTRGLKLNHPEAVALITAEVLGAIRDGRSVGRAPEALCFSFVSQAALDAGTLSTRLGRRLLPVSKTRDVRKRDLLLNDATPQVEINPENYQVRVDGELIQSQAAKELPLAQRYFLFDHGPAVRPLGG